MPVTVENQEIKVGIDLTTVSEIKYTPQVTLRGGVLNISEVTRTITKA